MRLIEYFKIPHPFAQASNIVVAEPGEWLEAVGNGLPNPRGRSDETPDRPSDIRRVVIQADTDSPEKLLRETETRLARIFSGKLATARYAVWYEAVLSVAVAYAIWLSFWQAPWLWDPINRFVRTVFTGEIDVMFRWAIVLSHPIRTAIKLFISSRANRKNLEILATKVEQFHQIAGGKLEHPYAKKIVKRVEKFCDNARTKNLLSRFNDNLDKLASKEITASLFFDRTEKLLVSLAEETERGSLPISILAELTRLRNEFVKLASVEFQVAPAYVVTPDSNIPSPVTSEFTSEALAFEGLRLRAKNLAKFVAEAEPIRAEAQRAFEATDSAPTPDNFKRLAYALERLRNIARDTHLGELPTVRMERGEALANIYHRLYVASWRAAKMSRLAILRRWAAADFLRIAENLIGPTPSRCRNSALTRLARTKNRGAGALAAVAALLVVLLGVMNLYTLGGNEIAVTYSYNIGVRDPDTGKYAYAASVVSIVKPEMGRLSILGRNYFWHWPGAKVIKMDLNKTYRVPTYLVLTQGPPQGFWGSIIGWLSGRNWGDEYRGLTFEISYTPTENFAAYNFDGKGNLRVSRDALQIIERWRAGVVSTLLEKSPLFDPNDRSENNLIFGPYLMKLGESGTLERFVSNILGQESLQRVYSGTGFERVEEVARTAVAMIKEARAKTESDETLSEEARKAKLAELDSMEKFIVETSKRWAKQNVEELGELRAEPNKLHKILSRPLEHIMELQKHEGLWSAIQQYTFFSYLEEKLGRVLVEPSANPALRDQLLADLVKKLNDDPTLSRLIKVSDIKVKTFAMSLIRYQQSVITPLMNLY